MDITLKLKPEVSLDKDNVDYYKSKANHVKLNLSSQLKRVRNSVSRSASPDVNPQKERERSKERHDERGLRFSETKWIDGGRDDDVGRRIDGERRNIRDTSADYSAVGDNSRSDSIGFNKGRGSNIGGDGRPIGFNKTGIDRFSEKNNDSYRSNKEKQEVEKSGLERLNFHMDVDGTDPQSDSFTFKNEPEIEIDLIPRFNKYQYDLDKNVLDRLDSYTKRDSKDYSKIDGFGKDVSDDSSRNYKAEGSKSINFNKGFKVDEPSSVQRGFKVDESSATQRGFKIGDELKSARQGSKVKDIDSSSKYGLNKNTNDNLDSKSSLSRFNHLASIRSESQSPTSVRQQVRRTSSYETFSNDDTTFSKGLGDEYIPDLNFGDLVHKWNSTEILDLPNSNTTNISNNKLRDLRKNDEFNTSKKNSNSNFSRFASNTPDLRESSYLDLNTLHAKVSPQPIQKFNNLGKPAYSKLTDYMRSRQYKPLAEIRSQSNSLPNSGSVSPRTGGKPIDKSKDSFPVSANRDIQKSNDQTIKRRKSSEFSSSGGVSYENVLDSLPENFHELPYSQRKKLVASYSESIDYSQFSLFAKSYLQENPNSVGSNKTSKSGGSTSRNNSFIKRPRGASINTIAGRLLQMSSTDLKKFEEKPVQKVNVDEQGALVLEHELGKVIGFGAWGTIRECKDRQGVVRAIKIVKSVKDSSQLSTPADSPTEEKSINPKVLEVFRKEIRIWKELHHPNILPILNHIETETAIFCITNRIYGGTLFDLVSSWGVFNSAVMNTTGELGFLISSQEARLAEVSECSRQILDGLKYMHGKGIVHADLKLENVLVEENSSGQNKMILCDFGMSRFFETRLSRRNSRKSPDDDDDDTDDDILYIRSKSSNVDLRKPYHGIDSARAKDLGFKDDSNVGVSVERFHGPSLQSIHLSIQNEKLKFKSKDDESQNIGIDSDLPHTHIGSLPYAAPELLLPTPPPLGPLADIWAFGVLMFTMCVGKLPFQHQYETKLRELISAGKFDRPELRKACLMDWIFKSEGDDCDDIKLPDTLLHSPSMVDLKKLEEIKNLQKEWKDFSDKNKYKCIYDTILGALHSDITKRWDLDSICKVAST